MAFKEKIDQSEVTAASFEEMVPFAPSSEAIENIDTTPISGFSSRTDFDKDEMAYPLVRLCQPMTPEVVEKTAEVGSWVLTGFDPMQEVEAVPLMWGKTRSLTEGRGRILRYSAVLLIVLLEFLRSYGQRKNFKNVL